MGDIDSHQGLKMSVGIGRVMTPTGMLDGIAETEGMCHMDGFSFANQASGFFSANIYLRVPDSGGELAVWNVGVSPFGLAYNLTLFRKLLDFDASAQQFIRSRLPPPIALNPNPVSWSSSILRAPTPCVASIAGSASRCSPSSDTRPASRSPSGPRELAC